MNNQLQIFNNEQFGKIRMIEINDKPYFVAIDIAKALGYKDTTNAIKQHCRWVVKHKVPHPQSKNKTLEVNVIPEGDMYRLITNSELPSAEKFESWVFDEVLPQIRKTGSYANNQNSINEFKGQLTTMVNNLFEDKLKEVKEYYKINSKSKFDLSSYIKKRLGILRADDEYEQVKARVFLLLNINKWEDLNVENYKDVLPVIDESIRIIKLDRPQQTSLWD
ncbi:BRO-N domain-containing protein [Clostridium butyricum]|uniref:BRO-N domain-containing protein n=1 Tax=Clostridium butyricum TaxID=1492 RepID=UPI002AAF8F06|nr:BRO family protein [Clostridium butyricum]